MTIDDAGGDQIRLVGSFASPQDILDRGPGQGAHVGSGPCNNGVDRCSKRDVDRPARLS